jgi:hypothetical protein
MRQQHLLDLGAPFNSNNSHFVNLDSICYLTHKYPTSLRLLKLSPWQNQQALHTSPPPRKIKMSYHIQQQTQDLSPLESYIDLQTLNQRPQITYKSTNHKPQNAHNTTMCGLTCWHYTCGHSVVTVNYYCASSDGYQRWNDCIITLDENTEGRCYRCGCG